MAGNCLRVAGGKSVRHLLLASGPPSRSLWYTAFCWGCALSRLRFAGGLFTSGRSPHALLIAVALLIAGCAQKPASTPPPQHSDLSGVWLGAAKGSWSSSKEKPGTEPDIPYTPWALERMKGQRPAAGADADFENTTDPAMKYADPLGFPRQYQHPLKFKIVQTDNTVYQFWEWNKVWRQIPLNKPHSEDPDITWYGESVGKWDGDTLVVDTVGLKDSTWMDGMAHPHSEALHVVERIRRADPTTLQIDFTFEDPVAYTRPWTAQHTFKLVPNGKMTEVITTMSDELHYRERFLQQKPPVPIRK